MQKISNFITPFFLLITTAAVANPNGALLTEQKDLGDRQIFHCETDFPSEAVDKSGENKYVIVAVDYVDDQWCVTMNRNLDWGFQSYHISGDVPYAYIEEGHGDGLTITSMASSSTEIVIVMTQKTAWKKGRISLHKSATSIPVGPAGENKNEYLSAIAKIPRNPGGPGINTSETWIAAYGVNQNLEAQKIEARTRFPGSYIARQWEEGYRIDSILLDQGQWLTISSKGKELHKQSYREYKDSEIDKVWTDGFFISDFY